MTDSDWGPWIEHTGAWRPEPGVVVHRVYADGAEAVGPVDGIGWGCFSDYSGPTYADSWIWSAPGRSIPVIRYRVKRPAGMAILSGIAANPKERVPA